MRSHAMGMRWKLHGELYSYAAADGLVLNGFLVRSKAGNKRAIINVFGMTGDFFSSDRYHAMCRALGGSNTDIFLANNRGLGSWMRFKRQKEEDTFAGTAFEKFGESIHDIRGAVDLLAALGYNEIILQGHSTGAQKIAYYQYKKRDKRVKGLILIGAADDYNIARHGLGQRFGKAVSIAKAMVAHGKGDKLTPAWISYYTAARFLSYADPKNVESRLFDYDGKLREFSALRDPMLVVFGSKEEWALKPVNTYISILRKKTKSRRYKAVVIPGADHSFHGSEEALAKAVAKWAASL